MAKSRSIGGIHASLSLKDGAFAKGLKRARAGLNKFGGMALKTGAIASGAMAAGLVIGTKRTLAMGAELDHLSTQTGMAASSLMKIGQAYKDNGRDAGAAAKDVGRMQKAIGDAINNPDAEDPFKQLGLSAASLVKMSPEEQFFAIGQAINSIQDPALKAAAAMSIFGKSGAGLITVFKGSNLKDVEKSLGRMPQLMDQFSGAMERADTMLGRLPNKSDQFFVGFTSGIVGQILPHLEKINEVDFTTIGENLGSAIAQGLEMVTNGTAWEMFALHAEKAIETIRAGLVGGLASNLNIIADVFTGQSGRTGADYYNAGIEATMEKIEALEQRIAAIREKAAEGFQAKRAAAIAIKSGATPAASIADVLPTIPQRAAPASAPFEVDAYQRRGLSLSGNDSGVASTAKQQLDLMTKIETLLRDIAKTREPLAW
jgi:hypothetical protein